MLAAAATLVTQYEGLSWLLVFMSSVVFVAVAISWGIFEEAKEEG